MYPNSKMDHATPSTDTRDNSSATLCDFSASSALDGVRCFSLGLAVVLAALLMPNVALSQSESRSTSKEVPKALLERLAAQYVAEDDEAQGLSETMKLRRYKSILREGAFAERTYADAENLHELLHLLLIAAKGKAVLEGTPESGRELMGIAARLAASSAPPDKRLPADVLLVRSRLDKLEIGSSRVTEVLDALASRYTGTPEAAEALIAAVQLARMGGTSESIESLLHRLERDHATEPLIGAFLESEGRSVFASRLFTARLKTLDGEELVLPRDTLGRPTLLHFWSVDRPGLEADVTETMWDWQKNPTVINIGTVRLADAPKEFPSLNIIGINLDTDRAAVRRFVDEQGLSWPVAFSGQGGNDPTAQNYGLSAVPAYWLISPDGRSVKNSHSGIESSKRVHSYQTVLASFYRKIRADLGLMHGLETRVPYYRSGAFLLDMPDLLPLDASKALAGAIPNAELESLYALLFLPPTLGLSKQQKAERLRQGLGRGRQLETEHGDDAGLRRLRAWMMVAARSLATEAGDTEAAKESDRLARLLLEQDSLAEAQLLAEYIHLSRALQVEGLMFDSAGARIEGFLQPWAGTELRWAAEILGVILATEASDEKTRMTIMRGFADQRWKAQPKLRGFLRDYCRANIDAAEFEMRIVTNEEREEARERKENHGERAAFVRWRENAAKEKAQWGNKKGVKEDWDKGTKDKAQWGSKKGANLQAMVESGKITAENAAAKMATMKEGEAFGKRKGEGNRKGPAGRKAASPLNSYGGGEMLPHEPMPVAGSLPLLNGGIFRLPEDAGGKPVIIQFWSVAAPPDVQALSVDFKGPNADLHSRFIFVGVNMDDSRAEAVQFLEAHPELDDWVHIFSGQGWHDPLARELDIYSLPRAVLVDRKGLINRWAVRGQFDLRALAAAAFEDRHRRGWGGRRFDKWK